MKRSLTILALLSLLTACDDSADNADRDTFYEECFSEATANANIALVQEGQQVCPNLEDVAANCVLTDDDYTVDVDACEITAKGRCNPGYTYHVVMREYAVKLEIDSPDYPCQTAGFEPYTN